MGLLSDVRGDLSILAQSIREVGLGETLRRTPRYLRTKREEDEDGFDRRFRTETSRMVSAADLHGIGPHQGDAVLYWPTRQAEFDRIVKAVGAADPRAFVFVDLGSGKGRVLLMASALPYKRVIGVDFSPALVRAAKANLALQGEGNRRCGSVEVVCMDAAVFPLPEEDLMIFLFNPFGPRVLAKVLANLQASLAARPRRVFLLYNNCLHGELVRRAGLALIAEGHGGKWPWQVYAYPCERETP